MTISEVQIKSNCNFKFWIYSLLFISFFQFLYHKQTYRKIKSFFFLNKLFIQVATASSLYHATEARLSVGNNNVYLFDAKFRVVSELRRLVMYTHMFLSCLFHFSSHVNKVTYNMSYIRKVTSFSSYWAEMIIEYNLLKSLQMLILLRPRSQIQSELQVYT